MKRIFLSVLLASLLAVPVAMADPPLRNYNGFSSVPSDDPLGMLTIPDATKWAQYMEDCFVLDTTDVATHYIQTIAGGGSIAVGGASGSPGTWALTNDNTDDDVIEVNWLTATAVLNSAKKAMFEIRFKATATTANQLEFLVGMGTAQVSTNIINTSAITVDNFVGWYAIDNSANVASAIRVSDVETSDTDSTTYTSGTYMTLSWYYDGANKFTFYKDDAAIFTTTGTPPTAALTPKLFLQNGDANIDTLTVDYFYLALER